MVRSITALLFSGCLMTAVWGTEAARGQDSPAPPSAAQSSPVQSSPMQGSMAQNPSPQKSPDSVTTAQGTEPPAAKPGFPLDEFTEFSAVMIGSMEPRDHREGYLYRSGNLLRNEGPLEKGYFITDLAKQVSYSQNRLGCVKDGHPYFRAWPFTASRTGHTAVRTAVGKETIDGRVCQVEDVTVTGKDLPVPTKLRFWEPEEWHGFPIKIEDLNSKGNRIVQFKDVILGPPDPTLFIYPTDCGATLPTSKDSKKKPALTPKVKPPAAAPPAAKP